MTPQKQSLLPPIKGRGGAVGRLIASGARGGLVQKRSSTCTLKAPYREPTYESSQRASLLENRQKSWTEKSCEVGRTHPQLNQACVKVPALLTGSPRAPRVFRWPRGWGRVGGSGLTHGRANLQARSAFSLISRGARCSQKAHSPCPSDQPPWDAALQCGAWTAREPCRLSSVLPRHDPESFVSN